MNEFLIREINSKYRMLGSENDWIPDKTVSVFFHFRHFCSLIIWATVVMNDANAPTQL